MIGHADSGQASCHGVAVDPSHQANNDHSSDHNSIPTSTCLTFKSAVVNGNTSIHAYLSFSLIYLLGPLSNAVDVTANESSGSVLCQVEARDWVFAPEVCLGPAFRSLAPPSLS
jgi:hypothetical protein